MHPDLALRFGGRDRGCPVQHTMIFALNLVIMKTMRSVTIIIPVYNEEKILRTQIKRIVEKIEQLHNPLRYEILLVENGSTDKTFDIGRDLSREYAYVRIIQTDTPSYGLAFKAGIKAAKYDVVVQFDIDFWDIKFLDVAVILLDQYDVVIGSKNVSYSKDHRPLVRRLMSKTIELIINYWFDVHITDTHGLKALKKDQILTIIDKISLSNHFFDTELLIRCYHRGYHFLEIPVDLKEIRETRFSFVVRTFEVFYELIRMLMLRTYIVKNKKIKQPGVLLNQSI